jgi:hypothetical protein
MNPRRVIVTLEIETDDRLSDLRRRDEWQALLAGEGLPHIGGFDVPAKVKQVQVNVVRLVRRR